MVLGSDGSEVVTTLRKNFQFKPDRPSNFERAYLTPLLEIMGK